MLLSITTRSDLWIVHFKDNSAFKHCLKKGTYLCRRIPHPFGDDFDDLVILNEPSASDPQLAADALVGLSYSSLMTHVHRYSQFPGQSIYVEEVAEIQAVEICAAITPAKETKKIGQIIRMPLRPIPSFVRSEQTSRFPTKITRVPIRHRVQRFHPAARRAC